MNANRDFIIINILIGCTLGGCAALAGYIAFRKRRSPYEGMLLGFILGPIGVLLECRFPYVHRPPVDEPARNSLRSLTSYQESQQRLSSSKRHDSLTS
jgi:hypothetical protein